jgi:hypothetical protein
LTFCDVKAGKNLKNDVEVAVLLAINLKAVKPCKLENEFASYQKLFPT